MANAAALKSATPHAPPRPFAADAGALFAYAMLTHPGRVRHTNQDACAAAPEDAVFVVCDGVGGAAGGEVASQLATVSFLDALRHSAASEGAAGLPMSDAGHSTGSHPHTRLHQAVLAANATVYQRAQKSRALRGMATTLVAALVEQGAHTNNGQAMPSGANHMLWLVHAGDSRAYRFRCTAHGDAGQLDQLTRDHSLVEEQVRAGILRRADAERSPVRNVITRAVGSLPAVEPEIASHPIEPGDLYLLASDGLTRELDNTAIARILTVILGLNCTIKPELTSTVLEAAAHALIDAANRHGGRDNITVLLFAC